MANHTEHRIWHVPGMLEAILFELPMKDLLLSQRVCKSWKASIDSSAKLQRSLFFLPDGEPLSYILDPQTASHGSDVPRSTLNPLLWSILTEFDSKGIDPSNKTSTRQFTTGSKGSWKNMLLSQPPINSSEAEIYWTDRWGWRDVDVTVLLENETGLTMGNVMDAFIKEFDRVGPEAWDDDGRCHISLEEY